MSLSSISINRPVFAWMLFAGAVIFGGISWSRLGLSQLPDVDFPVVTVNFTYQGANPTVMENDVIDIAEQALVAVEGVKEISSTSGQGTGSITLEFDLGRQMSEIVQDVNAKLSGIARRLPTDMDPPTVSKTNPEDQPIIWLAVTAPKDAPPKDLMLLVRDRLRDEFQTVPGVAEIQLGGWVDRNLRVWLKSDRMDALQISADDVLNTVGREHLEVPAGRIEMPAKELNVRFLGEAPTVAAFGALPIAQRGGAPVYSRLRVRDVADLEDGLDDVRRMSRFNGMPAVGIGIKKQRGVNAVEVGRAVKAKLEQVKASLPAGYSLALSVDNTVFVEHAVHELEQTLALAALLTALVCWLFLGSWSSTANVLLSIPFSIVGTFIVVKAFGFTLNTFTLLSLSLAVGVVVDDAIMVLENIVRHKEMGKSRKNASLDGATEITFAAMAATFSIIAIFLPVAFMTGIIGRYFFQFGITISAAAFFSLIEALTLTPMRTSEFMEEHEHRDRAVDRAFDAFRNAYRRGLASALKHRWTVLLGAVAVFIAGFAWQHYSLKSELLPAQDQNQVLARMSLPTGTAMQVTDEMSHQVEAWLQTRGEVDRVYSVVGGFGGGDVSTAIAFISMKEKDKRPVVEEELPRPGAPAPKKGEKPELVKVKKRLSQAEFAQVLRGALSKLPSKPRVSIQDLSMRGFSTGRGFPVEFTVRGPDWDSLVAAAEKLRTAMKDDPKLADVDSDYLAGQEEVQVVPDRDAAARRGVSMQALGDVIGALVGGTRVGKFSQGGRRNDIRVRLLGAERADPADILKLKVRNNRGELVRLSELVRLDKVPSLQSIRRVHRERAITLFANAGPGVAGSDAIQEAFRLAKEILPDGYRAVPTGSSQASGDIGLQFLLALGLGVVIAYMILASQFNSFVDPFTVLLAMPLSFTGAFGALILCGQTLNLYSGIGLILLMGLVKKNSILLVDITNQHKANGLTADQALLEACPLRLRPIVMTSVATIAGATPAAMSLGAGSETLRPMGIAIIGGILLSTFLTLFVVPAAYSLFEQLGEWVRHRWADRGQASQAPRRGVKRAKKA
jgi:HAE1 family hydrophobic/amphiphilic exporter-1